jgi:hypothetical protein
MIIKVMATTEISIPVMMTFIICKVKQKSPAVDMLSKDLLMAEVD